MSNESNSPVSMDDVARYFNAPAALAALTNAEMIAALSEVHSWARDLPIPTRGACSAMQKVCAVRDALAAAPVAAQAGQVAVPEMTDAEIVSVWQGMPGGAEGWLKQFGYLQFARAVLAAAPAAPAQAKPLPSTQPLIGKLLDQFSELPVLWGLNEPGALVRHGDVFKMLVDAGKAERAQASTADVRSQEGGAA